MKVMLKTTDVTVRIFAGDTNGNFEYCNLEELDQCIRTLQVARKWLIDEQKRKQK